MSSAFAMGPFAMYRVKEWHQLVAGLSETVKLELWEGLFGLPRQVGIVRGPISAWHGHQRIQPAGSCRVPKHGLVTSRPL